MTLSKYYHLVTVFNSISRLDTRLTDITGTIVAENTTITYPINQIMDYLMDELTHSARQHPFEIIDSNQIHLLVVPIVENNELIGGIIVGPYTGAETKGNKIESHLVKAGLNLSSQNRFLSLIKSLPELSSTELNSFSLAFKSMLSHPTTQEPSPVSKTATFKTPIFEKPDLTEIEKRYSFESKFMTALADGNSAEVQKLMGGMYDLLTLFSNRIPGNSLRSAKNIGFVSNTISRIAARNGGVHPIYLDAISSKYAIIIERQQTLSGIKKVMTEMTSEYTEAVHNLTSTKYSPIINRAITYIQINIGDTIAVSEIAKYLGINASYLSRLFKAETGTTLTDFINIKKVSRAKSLLMDESISVTDVALLLGYSDTAYFSKVFKKYVGTSPRNYLKTQHQ
ncbi:AraC family transcriptional regulator [Lentilactobacillus sp. Marseille-Q4993]|uniref:helix-turn-helix domain-containing protein n=1 Tax=Lentilactobacillus sp. Marseille-Q4993 TaxID=3039492 RepID=UPI0024BCA0C1|nr:AraC family transcriptional regulator [Lentilactobacillus sp. Marseille-Q4993]